MYRELASGTMLLFLLTVAGVSIVSGLAGYLYSRMQYSDKAHRALPTYKMIAQDMEFPYAFSDKDDLDKWLNERDDTLRELRLFVRSTTPTGDPASIYPVSIQTDIGVDSGPYSGTYDPGTGRLIKGAFYLAEFRNSFEIELKGLVFSFTVPEGVGEDFVGPVYVDGFTYGVHFLFTEPGHAFL